VYSEMKIVIFLDFKKILYEFIDSKFFQLDNIIDFEYIIYIQLHFPDKNVKKSVIIKDIDADNLYKKVVDLWKREKEKEFIIKIIQTTMRSMKKLRVLY
jgi:hypothetical protein